MPKNGGLVPQATLLLRSVMAVTLALALARPGLAEEEELRPTPPTPAQRKQIKNEHKPRKAPAKQIKDIERKFKRAIKNTSPNPKVQGTDLSPMPPSAPEMPKAPQMPPQPSKTERFLGAAAKVLTKSWGSNIFVWLPAISTDPNTGPTMGIMPVLVLADQQNRTIRHLLAPSYTYNSLFGQTGTVRYYWYPTASSQLYTVGSYSEHTNRELKARYENPALMDGTVYLRAEMYNNVNGSKRFFGLGPQSVESNESGYTANNSVESVRIGVNFARSWRATFGQRFRRTATEDNIIPDIPDAATQFPGLPGVGTQRTSALEFRLLWDTRDLPITPSRGSSGELFAETTSGNLGSDSEFIRYGLEGKHLFAWKSPKHRTIVHSLYEWANGPDIPFYELPSLGGRETLRGYGEGRFVDRGRFVFNVEHRITMASLALMGIQTNFEVAPFFDIGSVFPTLPEAQSKNFRPVYGGAFRAAVKPNVVGDVEVGVGQEGIAVFVDISYPF